MSTYIVCQLITVRIRVRFRVRVKIRITERLNLMLHFYDDVERVIIDSGITLCILEIELLL